MTRARFCRADRRRHQLVSPVMVLRCGRSVDLRTARLGRRSRALRPPRTAPRRRGPVRAVDGREIIVPIPGAERLRIDNPLGAITVRAWDRGEAIHIMADKQSTSAEALARLRVHFTAWAGGEISIEARVEAGGRERALPLSASRVDLVVEVPAELGVEAKTFGGDLTVSGLRAGARLETTGGRIAVSRMCTDGHYPSAAGRPDGRPGRGGRGSGRRRGTWSSSAWPAPASRPASSTATSARRISARTTCGFPPPPAPWCWSGSCARRRALRSAQLRRRGAPGGGGRRRPASSCAPARRCPISSSIPLATLWQKGDRLRAVTPAIATAHGATDDADRRPVGRARSSILGRVVVESAHPSARLIDRTRKGWQ